MRNLDILAAENGEHVRVLLCGEEQSYVVSCQHFQMPYPVASDLLAKLQPVPAETYSVFVLDQSLKILGISIFYDKESLEWGDKWKDKIIDGTKKAEFAIIVISENFFDREWTEKELNEFLNRQNRNGQKLILPILHNITAEQLKEKYPSVADIQGIPSNKYSCDQIALLFARQLIRRLKSA